MKPLSILIALVLFASFGQMGCKPKSPKTYKGPVNKEYKTFSGRSPREIKRSRSDW